MREFDFEEGEISNSSLKMKKKKKKKNNELKMEVIKNFFCSDRFINIYI